MSETEHNADDMMTVGEAREYLSVSRGKMTDLIKRGTLATHPDPLDKRVRLVLRADVEKLRRQSKRAA